MTNYTLTQAQYDELSAIRLTDAACRVLKSLKPNSQEPVGYQYKDRDGNWCNFMNEKHLADTRADGSWPIRAIYTHQAPISKEDMVKVLGALQQAGIPAHLDVSAKGKANYSVLREAITIMQSAIEGMK